MYFASAVVHQVCVAHVQLSVPNLACMGHPQLSDPGPLLIGSHIAVLLYSVSSDHFPVVRSLLRILSRLFSCHISLISVLSGTQAVWQFSDFYTNFPNIVSTTYTWSFPPHVPAFSLEINTRITHAADRFGLNLYFFTYLHVWTKFFFPPAEDKDSRN